MEKGEGGGQKAGKTRAMQRMSKETAPRRAEQSPVQETEPPVMGISFNMKKGEQHSLGQTCQTNESLWSQEIHRPHSRASSLGNQRGVTGKRILHPTENFRGTQPWYGPTTNHKVSTTWILMFGTKVTWMETT